MCPLPDPTSFCGITFLHIPTFLCVLAFFHVPAHVSPPFFTFLPLSVSPVWGSHPSLCPHLSLCSHPFLYPCLFRYSPPPSPCPHLFPCSCPSLCPCLSQVFLFWVSTLFVSSQSVSPTFSMSLPLIKGPHLCVLPLFPVSSLSHTPALTCPHLSSCPFFLMSQLNCLHIFLGPPFLSASMPLQPGPNLSCVAFLRVLTPCPQLCLQPRLSIHLPLSVVPPSSVDLPFIMSLPPSLWPHLHVPTSVPASVHSRLLPPLLHLFCMGWRQQELWTLADQPLVCWITFGVLFTSGFRMWHVVVYFRRQNKMIVKISFDFLCVLSVRLCKQCVVQMKEGVWVCVCTHVHNFFFLPVMCWKCTHAFSPFSVVLPFQVNHSVKNNGGRWHAMLKTRSSSLLLDFNIPSTTKNLQQRKQIVTFKLQHVSCICKGEPKRVKITR